MDASFLSETSLALRTSASGPCTGGMPFVGLEDDEIHRVLSSEGGEANFSDLFVGDETCKRVAAALRNCLTKTSLVMRGNGIG